MMQTYYITDHQLGRVMLTFAPIRSKKRDTLMAWFDTQCKTLEVGEQLVMPDPTMPVLTKKPNGLWSFQESHDYKPRPADTTPEHCDLPNRVGHRDDGQPFCYR